MKVRLIVSIMVVIGLVGCGSQNNSLPQFAKSVPIASIDDGDRLVTYNEGLDVVCIENTSSGKPATHGHAAFACWDASTAPKKMQEIIARYLSGKK